MAIKLQSTASIHTTGQKFLVYGQSGAGKTKAIATLPNPVILSAESGLLSLSGTDIPYIHITNADELREAYQWVMESSEAKGFDSIALDSISEIAEVVLSAEKKTAKDPRQAYGSMQEQMADIIRAFRDIPQKHVYFSAKMEKSQDENGRMMYAPSMPGNKTGQSLPYYFDLVMALRVEKTDGETIRMLQCESDGLWQAKDRSGKLDAWEQPDLSAIIKKIGG